MVCACHAAGVADQASSPNAEITLWYSIQSSHDPADFRNYLRQFPGGTFAELAANRVSKLDPNGPGVSVDTVVPLSPAVMDRQALSLLDFTFWDSMKGSNDPSELAAYLRKFPQGMFRDRVRRHLQTLKGQWIPPDYPNSN